MAPPQLARDVPVADVGEPVLPGLLESLGEDPRPAAAGRLERPFGERCGPDEPLGLEPRFDDVVAPLAAPDDHLVRHRRHEVAGRLQVGDDRRPRIEPVHPVVARPGRGDRRVVGQDGRRRETVAQTRLVVIVVVGRGDLDRAGPECGVHDVVGDDRHVALHERDAHPAPDE